MGKIMIRSGLLLLPKQFSLQQPACALLFPWCSSSQEPPMGWDCWPGRRCMHSSSTSVPWIWFTADRGYVSLLSKHATNLSMTFQRISYGEAPCWRYLTWPQGLWYACVLWSRGKQYASERARFSQRQRICHAFIALWKTSFASHDSSRPRQPAQSQDCADIAAQPPLLQHACSVSHCTLEPLVQLVYVLFTCTKASTA